MTLDLSLSSLLFFKLFSPCQFLFFFKEKRECGHTNTSRLNIKFEESIQLHFVRKEGR